MVQPRWLLFFPLSLSIKIQCFVCFPPLWSFGFCDCVLVLCISYPGNMVDLDLIGQVVSSLSELWAQFWAIQVCVYEPELSRHAWQGKPDPAEPRHPLRLPKGPFLRLPWMSSTLLSERRKCSSVSLKNLLGNVLSLATFSPRCRTYLFITRN